MLLVGPAVVTLLEPWQAKFFARGLGLAAIAAGGAVAAFVVLRRSVSVPAAAIVVVLVANDLTFQLRGIGVIAEKEIIQELRTPTEGYTVTLRNDRGLFRMRNRYETPGELMVARIQSDFGPGRHVLEYQELTDRILSHDSPLLDLMNIKYLGEVRHRRIESPTPSLIAQQYAVLSPRQEIVLTVNPPLDTETLEVVSTTFAGSPAPPGQTLGELRLESDSGETAVVPLRQGIETANGAQNDVVSAATSIPVTFYIDVTDSGSLRRTHYLAKLHFPALRVSRIRLRGIGNEWGLHVKELYLVPRGPDSGGWRRVLRERADADRVLNVYENTNVMPRATLVARARVAASRGEALSLVARPDFDPRTEVVLEDTPAVPATDADAGTPAGTVRIDRYEPERISLTADVAPPGGWLVLSEVFFPGWTATVEGAPVPIVKADAAFRAVRLEAGPHAIDFRYQPRSFRLGMTLTAVAGSVLLVILLALGLPGLRSKVAGLRGGPDPMSLPPLDRG
jgi:hypothetical protein